MKFRTRNRAPDRRGPKAGPPRLKRWHEFDARLLVDVATFGWLPNVAATAIQGLAALGAIALVSTTIIYLVYGRGPQCALDWSRDAKSGSWSVELLKPSQMPEGCR